MKIIILTTETPHHLYFVNQISNFFDISAVISEQKALKPSFETFHSFEEERDLYEKNKFLLNKNIKFEDFCPVINVENINDKQATDFAKSKKPEIIISFGSSIIKKELIEVCPKGFINLHGGDPEYYRGLDSHLWAIYHKDFSQLIVTLHRVNSKIDDGEIIHQSNIKLNNELDLYKLRSENTKVCVELVLSSLLRYKVRKNFLSKPQLKKGRYYSFMPSSLKEISLNNYNEYIKNL